MIGVGLAGIVHETSQVVSIGVAIVKLDLARHQGLNRGGSGEAGRVRSVGSWARDVHQFAVLNDGVRSINSTTMSRSTNASMWAVNGGVDPRGGSVVDSALKSVAGFVDWVISTAWDKDQGADAEASWHIQAIASSVGELQSAGLAHEVTPDIATITTNTATSWRGSSTVGREGSLLSASSSVDIGVGIRALCEQRARLQALIHVEISTLGNATTVCGEGIAIGLAVGSSRKSQPDESNDDQERL